MRTPDTATIALRVVVLSATSEARRADPIVFLTGGPGQGAATVAQDLTRSYATLRQVRDIVLVDQRGTGASEPLACEAPTNLAEFFESILPLGSIRACLALHASRVPLDAFSTVRAADDLDIVRRRLGYEQLNLDGESYGTRLAQVYAARYPERVRTLTLRAVVPPRFDAPLTYARTLYEALDSLTSDCDRDPACSASYPRLAERLKALRERLAVRPVQLRARGSGAEGVAARFDADDFDYALRGMMYGRDAYRVPSVVARFDEPGVADSLAASYLARHRAMWSVASVGHHLAVFCREDVIFAARDMPAGAYARFHGYMTASYRAACEGFFAQAEKVLQSPLRGSIPTLAISGRRDPVTPPWMANAALRELSDVAHAVFPYGGHGYTGTRSNACQIEIQRRFLDVGTARGLDVSCASSDPPSPFVGTAVPPR